MKIDHFAFEVSNLRASIYFYVEKLGFMIQFDEMMDDKEHEAFAVLEMDGGKLELIQALSEDNQPKPFQPIVLREHYCPHLALQVDDMDQTIAMLEAEEIPIVRGPLEIPGVAKWLYVCDPDQNMLEFCQEFNTSRK
jgi:catechol 2,3-dioxygenase-like lactoylglutathione lyase family enzyme